jgi:hypothetical protein
MAIDEIAGLSDGRTVRWGGLLGVALALFVACASYTSGIAHDEWANTRAAYFYGHFGTNPRSTSGGGDSTLGFVIACDDGATYTIRFSNENRFQVVKAEPARCSLEKIVFAGADGTVRREVSPPQGWAQSQEFAAGRAYYLGDYVGVTSYDVKTRELSWHLQTADDRYDLSTRALRESSRNIATLPTEDRAFVRLAPAPP